MRKIFILFTILGAFALSAKGISLEQYLANDHNGIKKILKTLKPCAQANYKKMLKLNYKKLAKKHEESVKKFCSGKIPPKKIKYKGKKYEAYMFYEKKNTKCEAGTKWFLPKSDCKTLGL